MAVHVDQVVSDVTAEAETPAAPASGTNTWEELERLRAAHIQMARDRRRTAAEGYDD